MSALKQFETFGEVIAWLRLRKQMTVYALAQAAELPHQTVYQIEAGAAPTFETARRLASALGASLDEIAARMPDLE